MAKQKLTRKQKDALNRKIRKANKRLKEMRKHYKGGNKALDFAELSIKKTGGKKKFRKKAGMSKTEYNVLNRALDKLINSPFSTPQGRKEVTEKAFKTYAKNRGLDYEKLSESFEKMGNILSSNVFSKIMEQFEYDSENVMDVILNASQSDMTSSDIIDLLKDYNTSNKDKSLRVFIDEFLENEGQRLQ